MSEIDQGTEINPEESGNPRKSNRSRYFIITAVVVVLVAAITTLIIQKSKLEEEKAKQEQALNLAYVQLDSISNELNERIITISQLGGEIDTLLAIQSQLEEEKKQLLNRDERRQLTIRDLQDKVEGYQELLVIKDEEIKQLTAINAELLSENTGLKEEAAELNQSIREINQVRSELEGQIQLVSQLQIEGMEIMAVSSRGRERSNEFRNRHIDQLKIQFAVRENKVAPIEGKDLLVRITAPDGNVIFDVTKGSGTFMFDGREMFYSSKKEILYDRTRQNV
ncbi:MAG: chromosome segregation protein SMC, partial [Proteobacteria bacterium]|nr:chromosome segregation protein SMC [Pseudomonadota bacterium]